MLVTERIALPASSMRNVKDRKQRGEAFALDLALAVQARPQTVFFR